MDFMRDCGVMGYLVLILAIAGIIVSATWGRKNGKPGGVATGFAAALLSAGAMGYGMGMQKVAAAVQGTEAAGRADLLNIGSREASGNLLLAGLCGLVLLAVGGILALLNRQKQ
jgi:hypothetical protein